MEDTHGEIEIMAKRDEYLVLILIIMEDTHGVEKKDYEILYALS